MTGLRRSGIRGLPEPTAVRGQWQRRLKGHSSVMVRIVTDDKDGSASDHKYGRGGGVAMASGKSVRTEECAQCGCDRQGVRGIERAAVGEDCWEP